MRWHEEQDYARNDLLLSAVLGVSMQIKLAGDANASSSAAADDNKAAMPSHLGHWGSRDHSHRGGLNTQSHVSSKQTHLGLGPYPKRGIAMTRD